MNWEKIRTAHVCDEESTMPMLALIDPGDHRSLPVWLCTDLICDGSKKSSVTLLECGSVWIGNIEVERGVLQNHQRSRLELGDDVLPEFSRGTAVHHQREFFRPD